MSVNFDTEAFHAALDSQRSAMGMTWKDVAAEAGVERIDAYADVSGEASGRGRPRGTAEVVRSACGDVYSDRGCGKEEGGAAAQITAVLRADKSLSKASAEAIEQILKAAYKRFREPES